MSKYGFDQYFQAFSANFRGLPVPEVFRKHSLSDAAIWYGGFEWFFDDHQNMEISAGWTTNPEVLNNLFTFAQANHSGSVYALWRQHPDQTTEEMPVVFFGDEGGEVIVAENARDFMRLLSVPADWYVDTAREEGQPDEINGYEIEAGEYEPEDIEACVAWFRAELGLEPLTVEQAQAHIEAVRARLQPAFDRWAEQF